MAQAFIVYKKSIQFELHVDGRVEVKPIPHQRFSDETLKVLAEAHTVSIRSWLLKHREHDFVELAVHYFTTKGFEIKEK